MQQVSKAIIKLSGRDFIVTKNMVLSTFSLKEPVGKEITIPVVMGFNNNNEIMSEKCTATAIIERNYKGAKVTAFKMKNRTKTRRTRGSRAHCTTLKITDILIGGN